MCVGCEVNVITAGQGPKTLTVTTAGGHIHETKKSKTFQMELA